MTTLHIPAHVGTQQIDDFPAEGCERSVKGALYIRPGTLEVTADEWKHIQAKHAALAAKLQIVAEVSPTPPASVIVPVAKAEPEALPVLAEEVAPSEDKPSGKRQK